jgi:hypothetical protein
MQLMQNQGDQHVSGTKIDNRTLKYAREKLFIATSTLVQSHESLASRLKSAALTLHVLKANDFNDELGLRWTEIWTKLTAVEDDDGEGVLNASVDALSSEELSEVASDIHSLFYNVTKLCERNL